MIPHGTFECLATLTSTWRYFDDEWLESVLVPLLGGTAWWVGVVFAAGAGALHALGPGHGKTLIGTYLAGTRGRPADAVALGALVAIMHTGAVLAVGLLFYTTQRSPAGDRLEGWLRLMSAVVVTATGVGLFRQALRRRAAIQSARTPTSVSRHRHVSALRTEPAHRHGNGWEGTSHHALPEGVAPLSRVGIAAIATSGGLLPSPAAFLVLATALALGRTGYGLLLVGSFGVGLAATLASVGLSVLWGRHRLTRHAAGRVALLVANLPFFAAAVLMFGGLSLAVLAVGSI